MNAARQIAELLRGAELARILAVRPSTLARWRRVGTGPRFIRVGGAIRYRPEDVDVWLRSNSTAAQLNGQRAEEGAEAVAAGGAGVGR